MDESSDTVAHHDFERRAPKTFSLEHFIRQIGAAGRTKAPENVTFLQVADLTLDLETREVHRSGHLIQLTVRQFFLLEYLMRSPGRVHTQKELCQRVWHRRSEPRTNMVAVTIQRLRHKIDAGYTSVLLHTVRGFGYTVRFGP